MNNIKIIKNWEDDSLLELKIEAMSEYISVNQLCYIQDTDLEGNGIKIKEFSYNFTNSCYVEFGKKEGSFTPAFSLEFLPSDTSGKIKIEVDMEIADNEERKHRCCFYVDSEIGLVEQFGMKLIQMATQNILEEISLNI
ncbi:hypothetical protein CKN82_08185 [Carnobacterium divergens]|uniref:hypothetical protein n=1 Tax=Carnobacterium divergens TaxID=2748 RepID=UPI0010721F5A|nr:hypothetical protein [Carnobacterium divergens]MDT1996876.1 hypothetical protein [Carnobacterium divergens]TFI68288.1 hypothetical protein CKN70_08235 [Carnobacterium divergens]TFI80599.1 hypothetical protein CKN68_08195 [Carnobacterium divergens]TFI88430.1 hypothetical protein CKN72_08065 [Carnobacterium divergens]TFI89306.1 hypothetical protein CKN61_08615 [Carnobacterium divergens]